jgi:hypothetical protein
MAVAQCRDEMQGRVVFCGDVIPEHRCWGCGFPDLRSVTYVRLCELSNKHMCRKPFYKTHTRNK